MMKGEELPLHILSWSAENAKNYYKRLKSCMNNFPASKTLKTICDCMEGVFNNMLWMHERTISACFQLPWETRGTTSAGAKSSFTFTVCIIFVVKMSKFDKLLTLQLVVWKLDVVLCMLHITHYKLYVIFTKNELIELINFKII